MPSNTSTTMVMQTSLMTLAQDILSDVKEAGEDQELLQYAARRATRRLRMLQGERNPDAEVLQGLADRAKMSDVRELSGLLDELQLAAAG